LVVFGSYVCNGCSIPYNGCSIPFTFNRILLAPFDSAMTDQHQHRATPEQWAKVKGYAPGLEVCSCLIELRDRIEALEATQHAHAITGPTNQLHSCKVGPAEPVEDWGKGHTQVRQHRATPEQWAFTERRGVGDPVYATCSCILELRDRIQQLEASQHAHIEAKSSEAAAVDQVLALQDQIRDGALTLADALEKISGASKPVHPFTAKYLFTASNILQDSFLFNFASSVLFDLCINGEHLAPGDGIKIAHRLGEVPVSGVYSTINYKVASVSKVDDGVWTVRAVRVGTSDSEPAPTVDDQLTLVDRVANALYSVPEPAGGVRSLAAYSVALPAAEARAAIREVAAWLRSEYPQREGYGTAWANLLDNEANC
jgi:hypothetical protein